MDKTRTQSTRYLCAAVQLDENLCDRILKEFLEEEYTVIGICHGVDIPTVLKSCLLAEKRRKERDVYLLILSAVALLFLTANIFMFLVVYCIAWTIVFFDQSKTRYEIIGKNLLKGNFNSELFDFSIDSKIREKLEEISKTQDANVIIYGGFSPFVGAGLNISGWSFSVDTSKGKDDMGNVMKPLTFEISEVFEHVNSSIYDLKLEKLTIVDNLYVNGEEIRDRKEFLPNPLMRPITKIANSSVEYFIANPTHSMRHYRCIRVADWQGEMILSIFVRFSMIGQSLFVEVNDYLLTPLSTYYHKFDRMKSEASYEDVYKLAIETLFTTFSLGASSITSVFRRLNNSNANKKKRKEKEKEIKSNPAFNYGAVTSLRESVSYNNEYTRYFQKLDKEMYLKAIEHRIIDSLSKFLDSKNIDTSDFKETRSTILNQGVMVSGGSVQAQNLTVGEKAKSIFNNIGVLGGNAGTGDKQQ